MQFFVDADADAEPEGDDGEQFDECRCDERERMMIETMRAYLRPETAPACLYERLKVTLDRCCQEDGHTVITHTVIHYR